LTSTKFFRTKMFVETSKYFVLRLRAASQPVAEHQYTNGNQD
jgi:hypothetical protein